MPLSSGRGNTNDDHGDGEQAAKDSDTIRKQVARKISQKGQTSTGQAPSASQARRGENNHSKLEKKSGRQPGEVSPELGQDSGSAYQESQQMGETGFGGVQNPQANP